MSDASPAPKKPFHRITTPVTPDIAKVLTRYLEIQQQDQELQAEKVRLQEALANYLAKQGDGTWFPVVAGTTLKVRYLRESVVEYDEEQLRTRLGDRFVHVLRPDPKKVRGHLAELEASLQPFLATIGSPDRDKVRAAIEQGLVRADEFAGAFRKSVKTRVAVAKAQPRDLEFGGGDAESAPG